MLAAVRCDASFLNYAATSLLADREIILAAVQQDASFLKYAATALRADRPFILAAVQQDASFLKYASAELRGDREVVLAAVKKGRHAIEFAAPALLKAELELVLAAVHQDFTHLKHAPLRADVYAILAAIRWAALTGHVGEPAPSATALRWYALGMPHQKPSETCGADNAAYAAAYHAAQSDTLGCSEIGKVLKAWDPPAGKGPFSAEAMASLEEEWKAQCTGWCALAACPCKLQIRRAADVRTPAAHSYRAAMIRWPWRRPQTSDVPRAKAWAKGTKLSGP